MSIIIEDSHQKGVTVLNHGDSGNTGAKACSEAFSLTLLTLGAIGVWVQPPGVRQQALLCTGSNAELAALTDFSRAIRLQAQSRGLRR